jgi:hypothetical protein
MYQGRAAGLLSVRAPGACTAVPEGAPMRCQQVYREGARICAAFCAHCGTPLAGSVLIATSPLLEPRTQPPQACAPSHLAEKVLTSCLGATLTYRIHDAHMDGEGYESA